MNEARRDSSVLTLDLRPNQPLDTWWTLSAEVAGRAPKPEEGANVGKDLPGRGCHHAPGEGPGHRWMVDKCASDMREDRGPGGRAQV